MSPTDAAIRPARPSDLAALLAMSPEHEDLIRRAVADERCLLAETGDRMAGFCIADRFYGYDFLALLFVSTDQRRRRIATALVRAWEARAGSPKLFTSTNESNLPMQRLCDHLGYVRSGLIENLDEEDPEVVYFKPNPSSDAGA